MIEWPCNEVRNLSNCATLIVAFSSGGSIFDEGKWTVKMLRPGRMVDDKDIDYIAPLEPSLLINRLLGWWKLFQGCSYEVRSVDRRINSPLDLIGFHPRKHKDPPAYSFDKEWRETLDLRDNDFGKFIPSWSPVQLET